MQKNDGDERMWLRRMPFLWSCGGVEVEAVHAASPDAACPGLHWKPLDAAIKQLLAPNRPGGHQGNSKQNNDVKCTHFAGRFDGRGSARVRYRTHRPMEEVQGFSKSH